ncbi:MAG: sigma-70 family RNA polymerase sigma factor [Hormoscilla sp.]
MEVYDLTHDKIKRADNQDRIAALFQKLGYNAAAERLNVEELELPERSKRSVKDVYLIADQGGGELQVLLFQLRSSEWSSDSEAKMRMKAIALSICQRPSKFLLLGTKDYKQLILVNADQSMDDEYNLQTKIRSWLVDISNPTYDDRHRLEAIAAVTSDPQELYKVQCDAFELLEDKSSKQVEPRDSIGIYLQEIGPRPLLQADEEIQLARKIKDLLVLESVAEELCKQLGRETEDSECASAVGMSLPEFRHCLHTGRKAKNKMVESNLRLVVWIAKRYKDRGVEFQDLIQEGNIGLIRAVEKFNPEKGCKFSTYAYWWIRQGITRAIANQSRLIRLPIHVTEKLNKIKKTHRQLSQQLGRTATDAEVGSQLEITSTQVQDYLKSGDRIISFDLSVLDDQQTSLAEVLADKSFSLEEDLVQSCLREDLFQVMNDNLKPEQREVLYWHFGLEDAEALSLAKVGDRLNLSRERVRQIEDKSLQKLRRHRELFKDYIYPECLSNGNSRLHRQRSK